MLDKALSLGRLPHAFGGALALAFAVQHPRATADIDVNIFVPTARTDTVLDALPDGVSVDAADPGNWSWTARPACGGTTPR